MKVEHDVGAVAGQFQFSGGFVSTAPYGSGHINDTYRVATDGGLYILQRINHNIFKNPVALMENVARVTAHLRTKVADARRALTLIPARDGQMVYRDDDGSYWRAYIFIENARTFDAVEAPQQAFEAARAFGRFQQQLADLPAPRLHDTIPDFHHTPKRFAALETIEQQEGVMHRLA